MKEQNIAEITRTISSLSGILGNEIHRSHEYNGIMFYKTFICVSRRSGVVDRIPVVIPENLLMTTSTDYLNGKFVKITGQMYSHDMMVSYGGEGTKHHLHIFFLVETIAENPEEDESSNNSIRLKGTLCRGLKEKTTWSGKRVVEFFIAVPKLEGGRNNIPCVAWGENARIVSAMMSGASIEIKGRAQSRQYQKKDPLNPDVLQRQTVYEVAVSKVKI